MKDIEVYGRLVEDFIVKMTSAEAGQFRLEVPTFKIILERARTQKPQLIKLSLTDDGLLVNNLDDSEESLEAVNLMVTKSINFISSLIGEELARDVIKRNMREEISEISRRIRKSDRLMRYVPEPFGEMVQEMGNEEKISGKHALILRKFDAIFSEFIDDLARRTDLSALKLKLSILREKNELLKNVVLNPENHLEFDLEAWNRADDCEVGEAVEDVLKSLVGLTTFMVGQSEARQKVKHLFREHFEDDEDLLERYDLDDFVSEEPKERKVSTGFDPLDDRIGGGFDKGSSLLLVSPSGIERDNFVLNMFQDGLDKGYSLLFVTSKEPPKSIRALMRSRNLDPEDMEEKGRMRIVDWFSWRGERIIGVEREGKTLKSSKILSNLGIAINKALREIDHSGSRLAMVHIIGPATNIFDFSQVYNFIQRLRAKFKENDVIGIFLLETEVLTKDETPRIREIFDGTIEIKKTMDQGKLNREISVLNMSGVDFDARSIPFRLENRRFVEIGGKRESKTPKIKRTKRKQDRDTEKTPKEKPKKENKVFPVKRRKRVLKTSDSSGGEEGADIKVVPKKVKRRRSVSPSGEGVESPKGLLEDALSTIDELLENSKSDLTGNNTNPIKVKRVVRRRR